MHRYLLVSCISILAFLIVPLLSICIPSPVAGAARFIRTYANAVTGSDSYDGSSPTYTSGITGPKKTINAAIDRAMEFGSVYVATGTYKERIYLDDGKSLVGSGALGTIIDADSQGCAVTVAGNCIIMYFTITGGSPFGSDPGGGVYVDENNQVFIDDCAISGNYRGEGSGLAANQGGGVCSYNSRVYLTRCTVSGNSAGLYGGGVANVSTVEDYDYGQVELTNCTISGNRVTDADGTGGGLHNGLYSTTELLNVTIANNSATGTSGAGGGFACSSSTHIFLKNCIVANNTATLSQYNNGYSVGHGVRSEGNNLSSDDSCYFDDATDQINTNPLLGLLQNNGGPTSTHAIPLSSPAYNHGDRSAAPNTDQRGIARPAGFFCAIGAYEPTGVDARTASVNTGNGNVAFNLIAGSISNLIWVAPADIRCSNPSGYSLPYGMFSFNISNLAAGASVQVTLKFPTPLPLGIRYYKCINGSMVDVTSLITRVDEYTLVLNLTDGGTGDADGLANGTIVDPGGPAFPLSTPQSSSAQMPVTAPQKPVSLSNIAVQSASLSADRVAPGTPVTVTAVVANTGTGNGAGNIKVYVNGQEDAGQGVSINSSSTSTITFEVSRSEPGTYTVYVGGTNAGSFTVDQFTPDAILFISGALVFFSFILGLIWLTKRKA